MSNKKIETILKIMAIIAMFLSVFPLVSIVRISSFNEHKEFLDGLFYLAVILSTFIAVSLIMHKNNARIRIILSYAFLIIPIIASCIYFVPRGILSTIFGAFITAILCFFTIRVYFKEYDYIIIGYKFTIAIVMIILALILSSYLEEIRYLKTQFYVFTFIYIFFILVIKNQSNLDFIFSKRFDKASGIPDKMRSYNIQYIIVFFLLIVGAYYFRDVIIAGLQGLLNLLRFVLTMLAKLLSTLLDTQQEPIILEESEVPSIDYFNIEGNGGNPIITMICNVIAFLALAYIIYKIVTVLIIHTLIPLLKDTFKRLYAKIISLFETTEFTEEKTHYYTDKIERILPSGNSKKSKEAKEALHINKALKRVDKIENPKEKVKHLYGLILKYMRAKGMDIKKSYSTGEIYKRAKEIDQLDEPFREITSVYDKVKYGEKMPNVDQVDSAKDNTIKSIEILSKTKEV